MSEKTGKTSFRLTDEDKEIIAKLSQKFGDASASAIIRSALRAYYKQVFRGKAE